MKSRNQRYEAKKRADGLTKITIWVPASAEPEFKSMADFCSENRECAPFMVRSSKTGKFKKGI